MTAPPGFLRPATSHEVTVPAGTPHALLLAHANRVARLLAELSLAKCPEVVGTLDERLGSAWLPAVGVALSQALDLRLETDPDRVGRWVHEHAFPAGQGSIKAALAVDVPRYKPPLRGQSSPCPFPGPRGGRCTAPDRTLTRILVDPDTGNWAWGLVCQRHHGQAVAALNAAPVPDPNRGGVLARTFAEYDLDGLYRWADDRYDPDSLPPGADTSSPPRLRLLPGGGS